jgi:hypothetical protein
MREPFLAQADSSILFEPRYAGGGIIVIPPKAMKNKDGYDCNNLFHWKMRQLEPLLATIFQNPWIGIRMHDRIKGVYVDVCDRSREMQLANHVKRMDAFCNLGPSEKITTEKYPFKDDTINCAKKNSAENRVIPEWRSLSSFPSELHDNPMLASFPIPPALHDKVVFNTRKCFVLYTHPGEGKVIEANLDKKPMSDDDIASMVEKLGFKQSPSCPKTHRIGCGRFLMIDDIVKVDAMDCFNWKGVMWLVPVRLYDKESATCRCIVGYVKCLITQLHLFANRLGIVKNINADAYNRDDQKNPKAVWMGKEHGMAEVWFLDGILNSEANPDYKPWRVPDNKYGIPFMPHNDFC